MGSERMTSHSPDALRKIAEESLALAEKATPGPWSDMRLGSDRNEQPNDARIRVIADADDPDRPGFYWHIASVSYERRTARPRKWRITIEQAELNADFIAHARTSLPALASALLAATRSIEEQRARIEDLELMLAALLSRKWSCDEVKGGGRDGSVAFFRFDWDAPDPQPESKEARLAFLNAPRLELDGRGIPILTPAARQALAEEEGPHA